MPRVGGLATGTDLPSSIGPGSPRLFAAPWQVRHGRQTLRRWKHGPARIALRSSKAAAFPHGPNIRQGSAGLGRAQPAIRPSTPHNRRHLPAVTGNRAVRSRNPHEPGRDRDRFELPTRLLPSPVTSGGAAQLLAFSPPCRAGLLVLSKPAPFFCPQGALRGACRQPPRLGATSLDKRGRVDKLIRSARSPQPSRSYKVPSFDRDHPRRLGHVSGTGVASTRLPASPIDCSDVGAKD